MKFADIKANLFEEEQTPTGTFHGGLLLGRYKYAGMGGQVVVFSTNYTDIKFPQQMSAEELIELKSNPKIKNWQYYPKGGLFI